MAGDIPFDKNFDLKPGEVEEVAPGIRRILGNNPGPFTFKGTVSYIVGRGKVAIIDPGPDDAAHIARAARCGARRDGHPYFRHAYASRPFAGGAGDQGAPPGRRFYAEGPHRAGAAASYRRAQSRSNSSGDHRFPARRCVWVTARSSAGEGWALEAVTTPGHTANHMAYALKDSERAVCRRSCDGVVDPDRGAAGRRDERLHGVAGKAREARGDDLLSRATAAAIRDAPRFVDFYIEHRRAREASILHRLEKGEADIPTLVRAIYIGIDPRLTGAAGLSVLAHLEDLVARGRRRDRRRAVDRRRLSLGRLTLLLLLPRCCCCCCALPLLRPRRFRARLRRRRRRLVDVFEQAADARRHWRRNRASRIAMPSARRSASRLPSGVTRITTSSRKPMIERARHRLDRAVAPPRRRRPRIDHHAICAWSRSPAPRRRRLPAVFRHLQRHDIGIGLRLQLGSARGRDNRWCRAAAAAPSTSKRGGLVGSVVMSGTGGKL